MKLKVEVAKLEVLSPHPRNARQGDVDVICARFQKATGILPILERTNKPRSFVD